MRGRGRRVPGAAAGKLERVTHDAAGSRADGDEARAILALATPFRAWVEARRPGGSIWISDLIEHSSASIQEMMWGRYGEYLVAPASAVALMPDDLSPVDAAPLMCAGLTTFNALRNSGARPGDVVAVLGLGGLGHLGVQYASKMGFHTVGIARGGRSMTSLTTDRGLRSTERVS